MHNDINIFITRSNVCRFLWIPLVYRTTRVYVFITLLNRSSFVLFIFFFLSTFTFPASFRQVALAGLAEERVHGLVIIDWARWGTTGRTIKRR